MVILASRFAFNDGAGAQYLVKGVLEKRTLLNSPKTRPQKQLLALPTHSKLWALLWLSNENSVILKVDAQLGFVSSWAGGFLLLRTEWFLIPLSLWVLQPAFFSMDRIHCYC